MTPNPVLVPTGRQHRASSTAALAHESEEEVHLSPEEEAELLEAIAGFPREERK